MAAGYWINYRYDPRLKEQGKNAFQLDSKEPAASLADFLKGEVRYSTLTKQFPDEAAKLQARLAQEYAERYQMYKAMAGVAKSE